MFDLATLRRMWPHAPDALVSAVARDADAVFKKYGFTTDEEVAIAMGQFSHESRGGTITHESLYYTTPSRIKEVWPTRFTNASAAIYVRNEKKLASKVYNGRMGNRPNTEDGYTYRGRGLAQTTGHDGYMALSKATGLDLLNHPDYVNDPTYALECAVAELIVCRCLPYIKKGDVGGVSAMINVGHVVPVSKIVGYDERISWTNRWKRAMVACKTAEKYPEEDLTKDEVFEIQTKLRDLSYAEVGEPDGKWGSRTTGAISAFQRHEVLPVTGHYDEATADAMTAASARPVSPARAEATPDTLIEKGSTIVADSKNVSLIGKLKMAGGGLLTSGFLANGMGGIVDGAGDTMDKANKAKTVFGQFKDLAGPAFDNPIVLILGIVLAVGGFLVYKYATQIKVSRTEDYKTGVHAGTVN